jgi:CRP-like cAMP-binding protein
MGNGALTLLAAHPIFGALREADLRRMLRLPYKALPSSTRRITITQQEISQMIGLSRESTNKQLRIWEGRSWLKIVRGGVVLLDLDAITNAVRRDTTNDTPY